MPSVGASSWIGAWLILALFLVLIFDLAPWSYAPLRWTGVLIIAYLLLTNVAKVTGAIDTFDRWLWAGVAPAGGTAR